MHKTKIALIVLSLLLLSGSSIAGCMTTYGSWTSKKVHTEVPEVISYTLYFVNNFSDLQEKDNNYSFLKKSSDPNNNLLSKISAQTTGGYFVPVDSVMLIDNPTQFINHCSDGHTVEVNPIIKVIITGDGESEVSINRVPTSSSSCAGGAVWVGAGFDGTSATPQLAKHFTHPGAYNVKIFFSRVSNYNEDWDLSEEFNVFVVNPLLSISNSMSQTVSFHDEGTKSINLLWNLTNNSSDSIETTEIIPTGCEPSQVLTCTLPDLEAGGGLKIDPGQTIVLREKITIKNPKALAVQIPLAKQIGLKVKYAAKTNGITLIEKEKQSPETSLTIAFEETTQFNVRLFKKEQAECIGTNDEIGQTGTATLPKIKLAWDWPSIAIDSCDKKNSGTYIYCDPVQFSIELLKKLNAIDEQLMQGKKLYSNEITGIANFRSYLIGDKYSQDFRNDFDYYYTRSSFYNSDSFYLQKNFNKYFTRATYLEFKPETIESGIYDISIKIDPLLDATEEVQGSLFEKGEPKAKITINFTKIRAPESKNPFYYLPFNGNIGNIATDSDGRADYGLAFSGAAIRIDNSTQNVTKTDANKGANRIQATLFNDIQQTNIDNRGQILKANTNSIEFAPTKATPVLAKTIAKGMRAELYYVLREQSTPLQIQNPYFTYWTEIASSMKCKDFLGNELFYRRQDAKADRTNCTIKAGTNANAFGYEWAGIDLAKDNNSIYLQTIIFTPLGKQYFLENACLDTNNTKLFAPNSTIASKAVALDYPQELNLDSIQKAFDLVKQRKACLSTNGSELKIFWNMEEIMKALDNAKTAIPATQRVCMGKS